MDNRSVVMNKHTNLLELEEHIYHLADVEEPNTFRNLFPYDEVPKIAFNNRIVPHNMPEHLDYRYDVSGWSAVEGTLYDGTDRNNLRLFASLKWSKWNYPCK